MAKNTSVTLGNHFEGFIATKINEGRFESKSEAVRAALRLLEERESKLDLLRKKLATGETQLDQGEGVDGETFMNELID
ncbi:MAG: type II toxin-antitoxin system ParD family antitoxin [Nitrospirae bacterium]|nr:type II toxin-antitoxin system ParD family antitoxin [Candidatus Manganitrophaceae bacterium]